MQRNRPVQSREQKIEAAAAVLKENEQATVPRREGRA